MESATEGLRALAAAQAQAQEPIRGGLRARALVGGMRDCRADRMGEGEWGGSRSRRRSLLRGLASPAPGVWLTLGLAVIGWVEGRGTKRVGWVHTYQEDVAAILELAFAAWVVFFPWMPVSRESSGVPLWWGYLGMCTNR